MLSLAVKCVSLKAFKVMLWLLWHLLVVFSIEDLLKIEITLKFTRPIRVENHYILLIAEFPLKPIDLPGELAEVLLLKSSEAINSEPHRKIASEQHQTTTATAEANLSSLNYNKETSEFVENPPFLIKKEATCDNTKDDDKLTDEAQADYRLVKCETESLYSSDNERELTDEYMETETNTEEEIRCVLDDIR